MFEYRSGNELEVGDKQLQTLLFESLNREKELRRLLEEQLLKNDQLQLKLEMTANKNLDTKGKSSNLYHYCLLKVYLTS